MKNAVTAILLALAAAATGGALFLLLRTPSPPETTDGAPGTGVEKPKDGSKPRAKDPRARELRLYQSTATLREDLRDALAYGKPSLDREWKRVSRALKAHAVRTLHRDAPRETNPRVRALLVLAAGVHRPEELDAALEDRDARVRAAALAAAGYKSDGKVELEVWQGLRVPVGREPPERTIAAIRRRRAQEKDSRIRTVAAQMLRAAGLD